MKNHLLPSVALSLVFTTMVAVAHDRQQDEAPKQPYDTFLGDHAVTLDKNEPDQDPMYDEDQQADPYFDELMDDEPSDQDD